MYIGPAFVKNIVCDNCHRDYKQLDDRPKLYDIGFGFGGSTEVTLCKDCVRELAKLLNDYESTLERHEREWRNRDIW